MAQTNRNYSPKKSPTWVTYFVKVPYRLLSHIAYITLTPKTQVVLLDFIRHHDRFTEFGQYPSPKGGIPYAYGHCAVDMHRNTFARALATLQDRGFIQATGQMDVDGESAYFQTTSQWRNWQGNERQQARLAKLKARIKRREDLDAHATCTIKVHPPAEKLSNPLLKFWAKNPDQVHKKSAGLPMRSEEIYEEDARAHVKQEICQSEIENITNIADAIRAQARANAARLDAERKPHPRTERKD